MKQYIKPEITVVEIESESVLQNFSLNFGEENDVNRAPRYGRFDEEDDEDVI